MDTELRTPLVLNAAFSALSGLLMTIAPSVVGGWLGVNIDGWLRLAGIVLIGHAVLIAVAMNRIETPLLAKINLAMIAPYPMLMIVLVATGLITRDLGQALALLDGAIIAGLAAWHVLGLRADTPVHNPRHA